MSEKYKDDFNFFWKKINSGENFSFVRFADGEIMLMKGLGIGGGSQATDIDKWVAPNKITNVGLSLRSVLNTSEDNFYFAISSMTDNPEDFYFLYENIKNKKNITFANLWINSNYKQHVINLKNLKRDVIMICNESAKKENFPFDVSEINPFPNGCIDFWETNSDKFMDNLYKKYLNVKNKVFFVCCGPVSEIIINNLYKNNPHNSYIDMGSSLDEFIHQKKTRPYMMDGNGYSTMISKFPEKII
jgi:hypothetical protein